MRSYELHPLCTLFPRLPGGEFDSLRDDIKANGLRQMIVLHEGMILDGGNRYRACIEAGVTPRFVDFGGSNLVSFVLSQNMHRRHMTPGQQAAIVASAQDWAKAQGRGGDGSNQHAVKKQTGSATGPSGLSTVADRAAQSGASDKTQRQADKVAKADPDLAVKVGHGEVSLADAVAKVTGKPKKSRAKTVSSSEKTATATPLEKHDETPGPVEVTKPSSAAAQAKSAKQESKALEENAELKARVSELEEEVEGYRDHCADLADEVKALQSAVDPNHARKFLEQSGYVRALESQRDELLNKNALLVREIKSLQRKLGHV